MTVGNTSTWDAVVIGAGPAGAVTARGLALSGLRVLLVEKERFPRPKLCGGCLAPRGQQALERLGLASIPSLTDAPRIERLSLRTGARTATLSVPPYRVIERFSFDQDLVEAACAAGAEFREATTACVSPDGTVEIAPRGTDGSASAVATPRVTIVADGLKGRSLRSHPGFAWRIRRESLIGLGGVGERMPAGVDAEAITMFHGEHGYLGVARFEDGRADIAGAIDPRWLASASGTPPLESALASFGIAPAAFGEIRLVPGVPALTRRRERVEHAGRLFVCGDAAGYVEPFTGEGMSWVLLAAERLVSHATSAADGRYRAGAWTTDLKREWRTRKTPCRVVGAALRIPSVIRTIAAVCESAPLVNRGVSRAIEAVFAPTPRLPLGAER